MVVVTGLDSKYSGRDHKSFGAIGSETLDRHLSEKSRPGPARPRVRSTNLLLTISEVADILGVHRSTLYRTIARSGLPLPIVRVGATMRVPRAAVDRMLLAEPLTPAPLSVGALSTVSSLATPACRCHACGSPFMESSRPKCSAARRSSSSTASV